MLNTAQKKLRDAIEAALAATSGLTDPIDRRSIGGMAVDALATQQFFASTKDFLEENGVKVNVAGLGAVKSQYTGKGGANALDKRSQYAAGSLVEPQNIDSGDTLTQTGIDNTGSNVLYAGLEASNNDAYPTRFTMIISTTQDDPAMRQIAFLKYRQNQIVGLSLPSAGGPSIVATDGLSGCQIYAATQGNTTHFMHANAAGLAYGNGTTTAQRYAPKSAYMDRLYQHLRGGGWNSTQRLENTLYNDEVEQLQDDMKQRKFDLDRNTVNVEEATGVNIFGIRTGTIWTFYYQIAFGVMSLRTGLTRLVKGKVSNKYYVYLAEIPTWNG